MQQVLLATAGLRITTTSTTRSVQFGCILLLHYYYYYILGCESEPHVPKRPKTTWHLVDSTYKGERERERERVNDLHIWFHLRRRCARQTTMSEEEEEEDYTHMHPLVLIYFRSSGTLLPFMPIVKRLLMVSNTPTFRYSTYSAFIMTQLSAMPFNLISLASSILRLQMAITMHSNNSLFNSWWSRTVTKYEPGKWATRGLLLLLLFINKKKKL